MNLTQKKKFETEIQRLVKQHWAKRGVLYRYLCDIVRGSQVVAENKNQYIVQWHEETCRKLMTLVTANALMKQGRRLRDAFTKERIIEMQVQKKLFVYKK